MVPYLSVDYQRCDLCSKLPITDVQSAGEV